MHALALGLFVALARPASMAPNPLPDHGVDPLRFAGAAAGPDDDPDQLGMDLDGLDVG